jgi:hypothetical protein
MPEQKVLSILFSARNVKKLLFRHSAIVNTLSMAPSPIMIP